MCQITILLMVLAATISAATCAKDQSINLQTRIKRSPFSNPIFASVFNNANPSKSLAEKFLEGSRNRDKIHWNNHHTITHEASYKEHHKDHQYVSKPKEPCSTEKPHITKPKHEKPEPHHPKPHHEHYTHKPADKHEATEHYTYKPHHPKPHYEHYTHKPSDKHEPPKATSWVHFYQSIKNTHEAPKQEEKHHVTHDSHHTKDSGYSVEYWPRRTHHEVTKSPESHVDSPHASYDSSLHKNSGYSVEYWPKKTHHEVTHESHVYIPPAALVSAPKKDYGYSVEYWPKKTHYETPKSTITHSNTPSADVYNHYHKTPEATSYVKYSSTISKKTDAAQKTKEINSYGQHFSPYVYQKHYEVPQINAQSAAKQQATSYASFTNSVSKNTNGGSHHIKPYSITEYHGEQAQNIHIGKPNYYVSNGYKQSTVHGLPNAVIGSTNEHHAQGPTSYAKYTSSVSNDNKHAYFSKEHQNEERSPALSHYNIKEATNVYKPAEANLYPKISSTYWPKVQQGMPTTTYNKRPAVPQIDVRDHNENHKNQRLSGQVKYEYGLPGDGSFVKFSSSSLRR